MLFLLLLVVPIFDSAGLGDDFGLASEVFLILVRFKLACHWTQAERQRRRQRSDRTKLASPEIKESFCQRFAAASMDSDVE